MKKPYSVLIVAVKNGYQVTANFSEEQQETYVATSIKETYIYGSAPLVTLLDSLFNPREEEQDNR